MIWYYDIEQSTIAYLTAKLPHGSFRATHNASKLVSAVKPNDMVIFFNYKHSKLYDTIEKRGVYLFPMPDLTHKLRNRAKQLRELDDITNFPLNRIYIDEFSGIPHPKSDYPIMKTGDNHQGIGKYKFPNAPRKMLRRESVVYEEFVENHRGIRVLIIDKDVFLIEQINDATWIKNDHPTDEIVYHWNTQKEDALKWLPCASELVSDVYKLMMLSLKSPLLGVDYAVGDTKIGLLEANDMVGIPDDPRAMDAYNTLLLSYASKYLKRILL